MNRKEKLLFFGLFPLLVFLFSFSLRLIFFCGFVLGDDLEEYSLINFIQTHGPVWTQQLHLRFGVWLIHYIFFQIFGSGEVPFFLPTWLMSSSFGVFGYLLILRWNFTPLQAFWGGLFVASAPFEVLMGSVHSNDLILSWCLGLSLVLFFYMENTPVLMNGLIAVLLWFGFYTKLWVVYLFPALGFFFLYEGFQKKRWRGFVAFSLITLLLHGATSTVWYFKTGEFLPFLSKHAASYPASELAESFFQLFLQYPRMILSGSELGNSLFGFLPYFLGLLFILKWLFVRRPAENNRIIWGRADLVLFGVYGSFFILLNFFPNSFKFDQFYSAPRIFRYLTPLSFAATLHTAKMTIEMVSLMAFRPFFKPVALLIFSLLILGNVYFSSIATGPGRTQRAALLSVIEDIKKEKPPQVIVEYWIGNFIRDIYLKDLPKTQIPFMIKLSNFSEYENWLTENQEKLPKGTLLVTGLASYVYYGAHYDGFRLINFKEDLDSRWKLVGQYNLLDFLPDPEPARLWRWNGTPGSREDSTRPVLPRVSIKPDEKPPELFSRGMQNFDSGQCGRARQILGSLIENFSENPLAADARYFSAICLFRNGEWEETIKEFNILIEKNPQSIWVAGAHYHIGVSLAQMGEKTEARKHFETVIGDFSNDKPLVKLAREQLESLPREPERGLLWRIVDWFRG